MFKENSYFFLWLVWRYMHSSVDDELKLVFTGQSNVGKTSLLDRYIRNRYSEHMIATIGASFCHKDVKYKGKCIRLSLWDTAGQERYNSLAPMFYRAANAALLVFDVSNRESFEQLEYWRNEIVQHSQNNNILLTVVANKIDLRDISVVSETEARSWAKQHNAVYLECSPKNDINVTLLFEQIVHRWVDNGMTKQDVEYNSDKLITEPSWFSYYCW